MEKKKNAGESVPDDEIDAIVGNIICTTWLNVGKQLTTALFVVSECVFACMLFIFCWPSLSLSSSSSSSSSLSSLLSSSLELSDSTKVFSLCVFVAQVFASCLCFFPKCSSSFSSYYNSLPLLVSSLDCLSSPAFLWRLRECTFSACFLPLNNYNIESSSSSSSSSSSFFFFAYDYNCECCYYCYYCCRCNFCFCNFYCCWRRAMAASTCRFITRLGGSNDVAFDVNAACASCIYGCDFIPVAVEEEK